MNRLTKSSNHPFSIQNCSQYATILWCISIGWSVGVSNFLMVISSILILINVIISRPKISFIKVITHPIIVLFLLLLLSLLWSNDMLAGLDKLKTYLPLLLFPLVLFYWSEIQHKVILKGIKYLAISLIIGLIFTYTLNLLPKENSIYLIENFGSLFKPFNDSEKELFGWYVPFMERINYCNILTYTGIACIFLYIQEKKSFYILMSILFISSSFVMGARASILAVIIVSPVLLILHSKNFFKKSSILNSLLLIIILGAITYIVRPNIENRFKQTKYELQSIQDQTYLEKDYKNFTTLLRFYSWKNAFQVTQIKPIIGQGIGDYRQVFEEQYLKDDIRIPIFYHSQWLYFIGVFGILGTVIFIVVYLFYAINFKGSIAWKYMIIFSIYTSIVWIFDTLLLQKEEMMAFALFLSFATCLKKTEIYYT